MATSFKLPDKSSPERVTTPNSPQPIGSFLPANYQSEIETYTEESPQTRRQGVITLRRVVMTDGSRYVVESGEPQERVTDVPTTMTTPWLTSPRGYNRRMMLALMDCGFPVDLVSGEARDDHRPHLAKSAYNQLKIAELTSGEEGRDNEQLMVDGVSRAAMIGLGITAMAHQHNREVIYTESIVPCFPRGLSAWRDGKDYLRFPVTEVSALRHLGSLPFKILLHYSRTFDTSPSALLRHIEAIPTLVSGVAGEFGDQLPEDTHATVTVFRGDIMSQGEAWEEKLARYPNMKVDAFSSGGHFSCAMPDTYRDWRERQDRLRNEFLRTKGRSDKIKWPKLQIGSAALKAA